MPNTILGGGSRLNKLKKIEQALSRNERTVYVELTGNDISGDGSVGKPFGTVARAIDEMTGTTRTLEVNLGVGIHDLTKLHISNGILNITGVGTLNIIGLGVVNLLNVDNGYLAIACAELTSNTQANSVFGLGLNGTIYLSTALSCNNISSLVFDHWGAGLLVMDTCTATKTGSTIPLLAGAGSVDTFVIKRALTLTNITG